VLWFGSAEVLRVVGFALLESSRLIGFSHSGAGRGCLLARAVLRAAILLALLLGCRPLLAWGGVVFVYIRLHFLLVKYLINLILPPVRSSIFCSLLSLGSSFCSAVPRQPELASEHNHPYPSS
jgi:hypothetical protein